MQVNIGDENQKSGINKNQLDQLVSFSKEFGLNVIGLMCIPPVNIDPEGYFIEMNKINKALGFVELSMGMSSDYLLAAKNFQHMLELDLHFWSKILKIFIFEFFLINFSIIKKSFSFKAIHPAVGL